VRLKKFGILDDFSWDSSLPDFCRFNLIYGWNYSGKTTVSRVFRCFETGRLHIDYPEAILEVEDEAGNKFNNSNLTSKSNIRVFNMDFIRDNLKWESEIEPIFILGEESIKLQTDFDIKQKKVAELNIQLDKTRQEKREIKEKIATSLSERAKEIKFSFSIPNYNRTDFSQLVASVQNKTDKFILEEKEKERLFQIYNNQQKWTLLNK
jgi:wobble nucleotide-excising tRNase